MLTLPGAELPFDPALLPQPEVITQHLKGSLSVLRGDAEGFAIEQYSPILFQLGYSTQSFALGSAMMMPAMFRARGAAREAVCKNNLKQIGLAMAIYANDFEDRFPPTLDDLVPLYVTERMLFQCPSDPSDDPDYVGYVYVPGFRVGVDATTMVLFDKKGNHAEGRNVLFADGHVELMTEEAFQQRWANQQEEHNHPSLKELGDRVEE